MSGRGRRPAIATVVGMLFIALVFLLAIGAQAYLSNAQSATAAAQSQAQRRAFLRSQEILSYGGASVSLVATNQGPATMTAVGMILKLENGTLYYLNATSIPPFRPTAVPSGQDMVVRSLLPSGTCRPGNSTCLAVYDAIALSRVPGRALALVTSLGNAFWYVPSAASGGTPDPMILRTPSIESTSSTSYVPVPGLSLSAAANSFYEVEVRIGFWQSGPSPNSDMFAIAATNGTDFMFCGGTFWSAPTGSTTDLPPGNLCTSAPGQSLGPTWTSGSWCTSQTLACEFTGTAYVHFGPSGGTLQLEFSGTPSGAANVFADSVMMVAPAP